ncbi:hypothetical protein ACNO5E_13320 [Vibrio parahaemolyticus]
MDKNEAIEVKQTLIAWLEDNVDNDSQIHFDNEGQVTSATVLEAFEVLQQ